jgi:hypothetical protein
MDVLTPVVVGVLLALFTAIQSWINKGRFDAHERSNERRFDDLVKRMDAHEQSNERRFEQIVAEIAQLRSDLLQVALAAAPRPRPQTG